MYKRFYPAKAKPPRERLSPMQRMIVEEIKKAEGSSQKDIARRLAISPQVVNYHIKMLKAAGVISIQKDGRETLCYLQ
jgi:predicted transcriptional regulator